MKIASKRLPSHLHIVKNDYNEYVVCDDSGVLCFSNNRNVRCGRTKTEAINNYKKAIKPERIIMISKRKKPQKPQRKRYVRKSVAKNSSAKTNLINAQLKKWSKRLHTIVKQRDADRLQLLADTMMKWRDDSGIGGSNKKLNHFIGEVTGNLAAIRHLDARESSAEIITKYKTREAYTSKKKCAVPDCNRRIIGVWSPVGRQDVAIPACGRHLKLHHDKKSKFNFWRLLGETPPAEDKDRNLVKELQTERVEKKKQAKPLGVYASLCILFKEKGPSRVTHKQASAVAKRAKCDCDLSKGHFRWYLKRYKESLTKAKSKSKKAKRT